MKDEEAKNQTEPKKKKRKKPTSDDLFLNEDMYEGMLRIRPNYVPGPLLPKP